MWLRLQAVRARRLGRIVESTTPRRAYSGRPGMLRSWALLATLLVATCVACSNEGASPDPTTSTSSTTSAPTSSIPPELAGYSDDERAAYETAVTEYDHFTKRNDQFYAAGQTTGDAKKFYQRYAVDWSTAWGNLAQAANNHVTVTGTTTTVWTKPRTIELVGSQGDVVVLRRCLDESGRVVTQNGKHVDQPQFKDPHVYTVRLEKHPGEDWWRSGIAKQGETC